MYSFNFRQHIMGAESSKPLRPASAPSHDHRPAAPSNRGLPGPRPGLRARIVWYFKEHDPDRISQVETVLPAIAADEEGAFQQLIAKYGAEPHEARLIAYYRRYSPGKEREVPAVMPKFRGREQHMFRVCYEKYGPEPEDDARYVHEHLAEIVATAHRVRNRAPLMNATPSGVRVGLRGRLVAFFRHYNEAELQRIDGPDGHVARAAPNETTYFQHLASTYGAETPAIHEERLRRYYLSHPGLESKAADVRTIVGNFVGREKDLFTTAVAKYGPEAEDEVGAGSASASSAAVPLKGTARLTHFFRCHNPSKLSTMNDLLKYYAGAEDRMWSDLASKYGIDAVNGSDGTGQFMHLARAVAQYRAHHVAVALEQQLPFVLRHFAGVEEHFFEAVSQKYGPEPWQPAEVERLLAMSPLPGDSRADGVARGGDVTSVTAIPPPPPREVPPMPMLAPPASDVDVYPLPAYVGRAAASVEEAATACVHPLGVPVSGHAPGLMMSGDE